MPVSIIGLDPSISSTGWGVVRFWEDGTIDARWGTIPTSAKSDIDARLRVLHDAIVAVVESDGRAFEAAMETPFMGRNAQTALKLSMAQAALSLGLSACRPGLVIGRYPPATVKKVVAGHGRADKEEVCQAVIAHLGLGERPASSDASDALAVAYTHYLNIQ